MSEFKVNDKTYRVEKTQTMPLLWYLRDILNLTGTKYGCGKGLCGACTVHLNGTPVRSCQIPVNQLNGVKVTTIEGLADQDKLHPVQQAWIDHEVPQCGFCQAGQIMSASALIQKNPRPDAKTIDQHMQGHICRCGTYKRIRRALLSIGDK